MSKDDHYCSEDSESTQGSDLEYNLNVQVLLPNGTKQTTLVLASTPWGDVKTKLCSQFKLSPSTHAVEFISSSKLNSKRNASCPVGRMSIDFVTIKEKNLNTKSSSLQSTGHIAENSVRLIVRLARFRQHVFRVQPEVPLNTIFSLICDKLNLHDEAKKHHELRHPTEHDIILDLEQSLNHYNLREVYLTEKPDESGKVSHAKAPPPPPSRTKRKAPLPPSSPSPVTAEARRTKTSTEQIQTKAKSRKRAAPPPPQVDIVRESNNDSFKKLTKDAEESNANEKEIQQDVQQEISEDAIPCRPPRRQKQSKTSTSDDVPTNDDIIQVDKNSPKHFTSDDIILSDKSIVVQEDDASEIKSTSSGNKLSDDVIDTVEATFVNAIPQNVSAFPSDESSCEKSSIRDDVSVHSQVDDVNSLPEVIDVTVTSSEEHKLEECTKSIDDVLHKFNDDIESVDDVTITYSAPLEATEKDLPNPATPYGDIVVYDVSEDGNLIIENDPNDEQPIPRSDLRVEVQKDDRHPSDFDDLPPPPPAFLEVNNVGATSVSKTDEHHKDDRPHSSTEELLPSPLKFEEDLPPPLTNSEFSSFQSSEPPSSFADSIGSDDVTKVCIHHGDYKQEMLPDSFLNNEVDKREENVTQRQAKHVNEMTDCEKTALEIERLHLQIKKMKNRNSLNQDHKDQNRNTWNTEKKSFTFVPTKKAVVTHDDYEVAPVPGIELSNNGEIKTLHRDDRKEKLPTSPKPHDIYHTHSTLPSYYKKFLGMNSCNKK